MKTLSDLSHFEGEPFSETDPARAWARIKSRSSAWDELCRHRKHVKELDYWLDDFDRWLEQKLHDFNSARHIKANMPAPSDEAAFLRGYLVHVREVSQHLHHGALPVHVHAGALTLAHRDGHDWLTLRDRLLGDLTLAEIVLTRVERDLRSAPAKRGRKPQPAADRLVAEVVTRLQTLPLNLTAARVLAMNVLRAEGVATASLQSKSPEKSMARAARRVRVPK
jgi:hypothetical protein